MTDDRSAPPLDLGRADFDAVYRGEGLADIPFETPPWDIGEPQPHVVRLEEAGGFRGNVLDAGCGSGDNAIHLASRGHPVTGVDGSPTALDIARRRASERGVEVTFQVADATTLDGVPEEFDTVLDSALFHCLPRETRDSYVAALHRVTRPGARLHLLCFADVEGGFAAGAVSRDELRTHFGGHWTIAGIDLVRYSGAFDAEAVASSANEAFTGFDPAQAERDEAGRVAIPMWYLHAERA